MAGSPRRELAPIGDSEGKAGAPQALAGGRHECLPDNRCFALANIEQSGYAIVRSDNPQGPSMLFVTGMEQAQPHDHADDLSFVLYERGRLIFTEAGKYSYQDDAMRKYALSKEAHNTISIAGQSIGPDDTLSGSSLLSSTRVEGGQFVLEGKAKHPNLFTQERQIHYRPGEKLIIKDRLSARSTYDYVSSLYLAPDLEPILTDNGFEVRFNNTIISASLSEADCALEVVRGRTDPTPLGWTTTSYLKMEPTTVVRAVCPGRNRTIGWEIDLMDRKPD
ncbi:hypothetical protein HED49_06665 [Ochrobactrum daejeonense]|nr:hypothetical protein [Brucella daejeonensis]